MLFAWGACWACGATLGRSGAPRRSRLHLPERASRGSHSGGFAEHCSFAQSIEAEESICSGLSAQGKNLPRTAVYPNLLGSIKFKAPIPRNLGGQGGRCTAQITSYPPLFHRHPTTDYLFPRSGLPTSRDCRSALISVAFSFVALRVAGPQRAGAGRPPSSTIFIHRTTHPQVPRAGSQRRAGGTSSSALGSWLRTRST
jgi:hypothetical protein